jgi:ribosomal protein S24E
LRFKGKENYQLIETRFRFAPDDILSVLKLTNNQKLGFQWTTAVKGLSLCFINYAIDSFSQNPAEITFSGPAFVNSNNGDIENKSGGKSSVASLGQALGKKTIWVEWMFKSNTAELSQVIKKMFGGHNREGKNQNIDVTVTIKPSRLPPSRVKVYLNEALLTAAVDLENLLHNIRSQCPESMRPATKDARQEISENIALRIESGISVRSLSQQFGENAKAAFEADVDRALEMEREHEMNRHQEDDPSRMPPRGNKSLADWFGELSSNGIQKYIKAIISAPRHKIAAFYEELRDPQCINVMAEKLVYGSIDQMLRLYFENSRNSYLEPTLRAVCAAIDTDSALRAEPLQKSCSK